MIDIPANVTDLSERFENVLHGAARTWRGVMNRHLKRMGLSPTAWMILAAASQERPPPSQAALAERIELQSASMVRQIDFLTDAGLVTRESSVSDRRVKRIVVTNAGIRLYATLLKDTAKIRQQLLLGIDSETLASVTDMLEQLQFVGQPHLDDESPQPTAGPDAIKHA
jgi:MarR family transcriptional regulator, transcriptional regulator for hemolysin